MKRVLNTAILLMNELFWKLKTLSCHEGRYHLSLSSSCPEGVKLITPLGSRFYLKQRYDPQVFKLPVLHLLANRPDFEIRVHTCAKNTKYRLGSAVLRPEHTASLEQLSAFLEARRYNDSQLLFTTTSTTDKSVIGSLDRAVWLVRNHLFAPQRHDHLPDRPCDIASFCINQEIKGWATFTPRGSQVFRVGNKVFDPFYVRKGRKITDCGAVRIETMHDAKQSAIRYAEYLAHDHIV